MVQRAAEVYSKAWETTLRSGKKKPPAIKTHGKFDIE